MERLLPPPLLPIYDYKPAPYVGPSVQEVLNIKAQYVNPAITAYYNRPIMLVEGSLQYVFDETGKRYLDGFAGIATVNVGHSHPHVVEAIQQQSAKLQHATTLYLHPAIAEYSRSLVEKLPAPLSKVYLVNSGSEANNLAILMARAYTESFDFITLRNGYHGMSGTSMGLTSQSLWKFHVPHNFGLHHALNPDLYRGPWQYGDENAALNYANDVKNLIQYATSGKIAGFIAESIQGVGGTVVYPEGYLKLVYNYVQAAGGVFIADEVQTGFCRTGKTFWGFEAHGIQPDIVTLAKGIGNGFPLAAVVTTSEIAQAFTQKLHFNTFAGNPLACVVGQAVLNVLDQENLLDNCDRVGSYLLEQLCQLQQKHECIGDVRGSGLMLGVELVKDHHTKAPNPELTAQVHELAKDMGLLIGKGGIYRNVLRIKPPLCISQADADFVVQVLDYALVSLHKSIDTKKVAPGAVNP